MWFSKFPFLRYILFFFLGIWISPWIQPIPFRYCFVLLLGLWSIYTLLVIYVAFQPSFAFKSLIAFLAYANLVLTGIVFSMERSIVNHPNHLMHLQSPIKGYIGIVRQHDEQKPKTKANRVSVFQGVLDSGRVDLKGEVIIYHRSTNPLLPGQVIYIKGTPQLVKGPANPGEFDYRKFLLQQQISHQHFIKDSVLILGEMNVYPLERFFITLRAKLSANIQEWISDPRSAQIANALLLGQKKNLERDTLTAYSTAGAMHVLAVSGLHVGIIYGFFFLFFKPLQLPLSKRIVFLIVLIGLIWCYAFLTGLSPSVLRSATMFTLMSLALLFNRNPSIFNPVAISAVLLLMFDPLVGFAVGFQLSYAALTGILLFQPLILKLWQPKNKVLEYFWQISSVSIAAQIATFPISVYYFHTFPTYFLVANLVVIPAAFLIMALGIPFLLLSLLTDWAFILGEALNQLLIYLNLFIFSIGELPFAQITQLTVSPWEILLYYVLLLSLYAFWTAPSKSWLIIIYSLVSLFLLVGLMENIVVKKHRELIVFGNIKGVAINYFDGVHLYEYYEGVTAQDLDFKVSAYQNQQRFLSKRNLIVKENEGSALVFLPKIEEPVLVNKKARNILIKSHVHPYQWEGKDWISIPRADSLYFSDKALKLKIID